MQHPNEPKDNLIESFPPSSVGERMFFVWVCGMHSIQAPGRVDLEAHDSKAIARDNQVQEGYEVELAQLLSD